MALPQERFQPQTASDVLVKAFELYRADWLQYLMVSAVLVIPVSLLQLGALQAVPETPTDPEVFSGPAIAASLIGVVLSLFAQLVVTGALTRSGVGAMAGQPVGAAEGLRNGMARVGPLLLVVVLQALAVLAGLIALVIPGLIIGVLLSVSVPAFVVENRRGSAALSRSWHLVKPAFWHSVAVVVLAAIFTAIVSEILGRLGGESIAGQWVFSTIGVLLVIPFTALVTAVLYVELRARGGSLTANDLREDLARTAV